MTAQGKEGKPCVDRKHLNFPPDQLERVTGATAHTPQAALQPVQQEKQVLHEGRERETHTQS